VVSPQQKSRSEDGDAWKLLILDSGTNALLGTVLNLTPAGDLTGRLINAGFSTFNSLVINSLSITGKMPVPQNNCALGCIAGFRF
jgi:hypothetical protein